MMKLCGATWNTSTASACLDPVQSRGHGLSDRFLISVPTAQKPTPQEEDDTIDFEPILSSISAAHKDVTRTYTLTPAAAELHRQLKTDHVKEVNLAIEN